MLASLRGTVNLICSGDQCALATLSIEGRVKGCSILYADDPSVEAGQAFREQARC